MKPKHKMQEVVVDVYEVNKNCELTYNIRFFHDCGTRYTPLVKLSWLDNEYL